MTKDSVQELIDVVLIPGFRAKGVKFSSAGREDADVKMLGTGRPFYFEILDPKKLDFNADGIRALEIEVNKGAEGRVFIRDLQITNRFVPSVYLMDREDVNILKDSASTKCKTYKLLIHLPERVAAAKLAALSAGLDLELKQRNPTRVPRRADLVRDKLIHTLCMLEAHDADLSEVEVTEESGMYCTVELKTSAGTYVKEFVHGDDGRTVPSLATLLGVASARVITLDVLGVDLLWPPALNYE
jgi:tRNA pseudouridine synthase 10